MTILSKKTKSALSGKKEQLSTWYSAISPLKPLLSLTVSVTVVLLIPKDFCKINLNLIVHQYWSLPVCQQNYRLLDTSLQLQIDCQRAGIKQALSVHPKGLSYLWTLKLTPFWNSKIFHKTLLSNFFWKGKVKNYDYILLCLSCDSLVHLELFQSPPSKATFLSRQDIEVENWYFQHAYPISGSNDVQLRQEIELSQDMYSKLLEKVKRVSKEKI